MNKLEQLRQHYPWLTTSPRPCPFCGSVAKLDSDDLTARTYLCAVCESVETITKGKTSWWYHGWRNPDGRHFNADNAIVEAKP